MHFSTVAAASALLGSAYGHMVMNTPTPYGFSDLQTSPLNGESYLFPCQSGSRTDAFDADGANNPVTAGGSQLVKFTGSAVHGGGSCQFSVTYDYPPPSDPSKWMVIYTIIGGCPSGAPGNVETNPTQPTDADGRPDGLQCGNDSGTDCVRQFEVPIPKQLKNGNATFAWTWFNKVGNREMYMNCAPITISGGSDDATYMSSLPPVFVANIPGQCTTGNGVLNIPDPGSNLVVLESPTDGANGACPAGGSLSGGSSAGASSAAAATPSSVASSPGVFAPSASSAVATPSAVATSFQTLAVPSSSPVAASTPVGTGSTTAPTGTTSGSADKVACTNEGGVVCMGTDYFGLCDHGFAVKMAVAEGTKCENGAVTRRSLPRQHLHGRFHHHS